MVIKRTGNIALMLDRRGFMASAGSLFLSSLTADGAERIHHDDVLFASACKFSDGGFGAVILDKNGELVKSVDLPVRGHDVVFDSLGQKAVVFCRRPGNIATVFDIRNESSPELFMAGGDRHFYGHGAFSRDGRLLMATENAYYGGHGVVGIYDVTDRFRRVGELESHGIGPHQMAHMPDGQTLVVCNGGIRTHPSSGRAKLNLATMEPSIVFLDVRDGSLVEQHKLPQKFHQLSIRHLSVSKDGLVAFGCQYEGTGIENPQLLGTVRMGEDIRLYQIPRTTSGHFNNYIGSVCLSGDGAHLAATSPKGGFVAILNADSGKVVGARKIAGASGIAWSLSRPVTSTELGAIAVNRVSTSYPFGFDNHLSVWQKE